MLIPSIDLKDNQVVQLIQGERPAIASDDIEAWVRKFKKFPRIQLIDLDAAMDSGNNDKLVRSITSRLPCRVGGGIRTVARAQDMIDIGATAVIVGSSFFHNGRPNIQFAKELASAIGQEKIIGAVDSRYGHVVIKGWKESTPLTAIEAVNALEPYCGEFLYTHVDKESLMQGTDIESVMAIRRVTSRRLTAAGGITTQKEIDQLDAAKVDAVVGMAIYTGRLELRD